MALKNGVVNVMIFLHSCFSDWRARGSFPGLANKCPSGDFRKKTFSVVEVTAIIPYTAYDGSDRTDCHTNDKAEHK